MRKTKASADFAAGFTKAPTAFLKIKVITNNYIMSYWFPCCSYYYTCHDKPFVLDTRRSRESINSIKA